MIIGLYGHAGVGKDTAGTYIAESYCLGTTSFAEPLKEACSHLFHIPFEDFSDHATKNVIVPDWNKTPREIAQIFGTECMRNHFGTDFWIRNMENRLYEYDWQAVITDVRFQNEADFVCKHGILIYLTREGCDGRVGVPNHQSEAGIIFDSPELRERTYLCANNSTFEDLYKKLDSIIDVAVNKNQISFI